MSDDTRTRYSYRELNELEVLDVDALCSLYTIELGGEDLYSALAERVDHEQAAALLRRNGREEAGHARRLGRAIAIKQGREFEPTPEMLMKRPVRLPDTLEIEFLEMLLQGELDGDAGYQRWADNEPDPNVARLLRLNGREETIHGRRVGEVLALLRAG